MSSRNKRKNTISQSNQTHKKLHLLNSNNDEYCSFEGDSLVTLLKSFQGVIETERQSNKTLPDKLWYKGQFAVGVNEVTRLLERVNPLTNAAFTTPIQAVLVASECNPKWLTKHLPNLASSRKVPLIYVKDKKEGSLRLGELVKVKTAIAIGVKAKGSNINEFVQGIIHPDKLNETRCSDPPEIASY